MENTVENRNENEHRNKFASHSLGHPRRIVLNLVRRIEDQVDVQKQKIVLMEIWKKFQEESYEMVELYIDLNAFVKLVGKESLAKEKLKIWRKGKGKIF